MKEEYLNNATVKLLQSVGFSDDYIEKGIENGEIDINKAKSTEDMDRSERFQKENIADDKKHIKDLERDEKEDKKDEKDLERDKKEHKKKEERDDDKDMEKGLSAELMKSLGDSLGQAMTASLTPIFKGLNARMDAQDELLKSISKQAPDFRSGDFDKASTIEKSMQFEKGEDGKTSLSITRQRPLVKAAIEKALENPDIQKAYGEDALGYLMCPEADTIGKGIAQYLYDKHNIKLEK